MDDPMEFSKIKSWSEDWGGVVDYVDYVNYNGDLAILLALSRIFWPRFIEVDGCVLWDRVFEESNFRQWKVSLSGNNQKIEATLNQLRVWAIVESEDTEEERRVLDAVAERISSTWVAALRAQFPDRVFDVKVISSDDGPIVTFSAG
ncbi:hypothetical protein ACQEVI_01765 [Promicromonospora sp. CA-289599]|uniref:hypothetical protein n=1 Tax=Promicromonospora sp. CA-289599 TaxID=3240014 RepID=UPI003D94C0E1